TPPSRPPRWRIRSPRSAGSCPRRNTSKDPADRQPYPSAGKASSRRPEAGAPPLRERAIAHAPPARCRRGTPNARSGPARPTRGSGLDRLRDDRVLPELLSLGRQVATVPEQSSRRRRPSSRCKLAEQRLRLFQVERVEALGEPAVDGRKKIMSFSAPALIAPEPREAHRRAKLPGAGLLCAGDFQRTFETGLCFGCMALGRLHCNFALHAMDLCFEPLLLGFFRRRDRFANTALGVVELADVRIGYHQM